MSERKPRPRKPRTPDPIPPDLAEAVAENKADVQAAIDQMAEVGDSLPPQTGMTPETVAARITAAEDRADAAAPDPSPPTDPSDDAFEAAYKRGLERIEGHIRRVKLGHKSALIPPLASIHPKLRLPAYKYMGRWIILRWIGCYERMQQRAFSEGYQYLEGAEWCNRLGLLPAAYLNEKNRIKYIDGELAWVPEEYCFQKRQLLKEAKENMVTKAQQKLMDEADRSPYVSNVRVISGTDDEVNRELRDRREYASSRS